MVVSPNSRLESNDEEEEGRDLSVFLSNLLLELSYFVENGVFLE